MTESQYRPSVNAIITDPDTQYLLVQKVGYDTHQWGFVGGGVERDETHEDALVREVEEEIGLSERDYKVLGRSRHIQKYDFPPGFKARGGYVGQEKVQFTLRLNPDHQPIVFDEREIKDHRWVPFSALKDMLVFDNQYDEILLVLEEFDLIDNESQD